MLSFEGKFCSPYFSFFWKGSNGVCDHLDFICGPCVIKLKGVQSRGSSCSVEKKYSTLFFLAHIKFSKNSSYYFPQSKNERWINVKHWTRSY